MGELEKRIKKILRERELLEGPFSLFSFDDETKEIHKIIVEFMEGVPKCKDCVDFEYFDVLGECTVRSPEDSKCPKNKWFVKWFGE